MADFESYSKDASVKFQSGSECGVLNWKSVWQLSGIELSLVAFE